MQETNLKFLPSRGISLQQGLTALDIRNITPDFTKFNIYTITVTDEGVINLTFDDALDIVFEDQNIDLNFTEKKLKIGVQGVVLPSLSCQPPNLATHTLLAQINPNIPSPQPNYVRFEACYRCITVKIDNNGNAISYNYDATTNNLNLYNILVQYNLLPSVQGTYSYTFIFYGWRKYKTDTQPGGWISADDKYDIWTDNATANLISL